MQVRAKLGPSETGSGGIRAPDRIERVGERGRIAGSQIFRIHGNNRRVYWSDILQLHRRRDWQGVAERVMPPHDGLTRGSGESRLLEVQSERDGLGFFLKGCFS
jgi:hypothetical protein